MTDAASGPNREQEACITQDAPKILCIAGAGTGKTTVLTRRICRLVSQGVDPRSVLAITFTRKARQEMKSRLKKLLPGAEIDVETFNSFGERMLRTRAGVFYSKPCRLMSLSDRLRAVTDSVAKSGLTVAEALEEYFSPRLLREKDERELFLGFAGDMFSLIENYANRGMAVSEMRKAASLGPEKDKSMLIYSIVSKICAYKEEHGLRDFTDQLSHTLEMFGKNPEVVPRYPHVLVDEYQDVNMQQVKLLEMLKPANLFAVGDPRQSIFGWRGSDVRFIRDFGRGSLSLPLFRNYRSCEKIVRLGNSIICSMGLPELVAHRQGGPEVALVTHSDEEGEALFIAQSILSQKVPRNSIFVLARTNRQLDGIARALVQNGISFVKRTVEQPNVSAAPDQVTLSTVHAIKGLESEVVYLAGATSQMYPCQATDNPVLDRLRPPQPDRREEENRLLYVAVTRAKRQLVINHTNTPTPFLSGSMHLLQPLNNCCAKDLEGELREWRQRKARQLKIAPYMVFADRTMHHILQSMPSSIPELLDVPGIGDSRASLFGEELLSLICGRKKH